MKIKNPCRGVSTEKRTRKISCSTSSVMNTMMKPKIHESPMETKMEKYTRSSFHFSCLSALGAD
jgi:hypothetical protein